MSDSTVWWTCRRHLESVLLDHSEISVKYLSAEFFCYTCPCIMRGETHSVLEETYFRNFYFKFMYRNGSDIYSLQTEFWERDKIRLFVTNWPNKYKRFFKRHKCFIRMKDIVLPTYRMCVWCHMWRLIFLSVMRSFMYWVIISLFVAANTIELN